VSPASPANPGTTQVRSLGLTTLFERWFGNGRCIQSCAFNLLSGKLHEAAESNRRITIVAHAAAAMGALSCGRHELALRLHHRPRIET
jgi:hypothetical protein